MTGALSELEIGFVGVALTLLIFAVIGFNSVLLEGYRLEPGRVLPRLTNPLSVAIVILSLLLLGISVALGISITQGWRPAYLGLLAGAGSLDLAILLACYKEGFIGNEGTFDERNDGVPW